MKLLLINPAGSDIYSRFGAQLPPLGLGYIAAFARRQGHEVSILDLGLKGQELTPEHFRGFELAGITADTPRYFEALEVARKAKEAGLTVVMGGYHPTFMDKEVLETGAVDFVVRGEGELIFTELLAALEDPDQEKALKKTEGISYINKHKKFIRNKTAALPENLDEFPFPARDLFDLKKYKNRLGERPLASLITSRGCPYDCFFCASTRFGGKKWRYRSAASIADELELLYHNYGYRAFAFLDDNFTVSKRRIMQLADEIERRKMNDIIWWCFSRVDSLLKHKDMVRRMADTGAFMVFLGLESVDESVLQDYGKNINHIQQVEAVKLLRENGIRVHGSFIVGDITETGQKINNTIDWAVKLNPETLQFSILTPYPGTRLYDKLNTEKRILHKQWNLYDGFHSVVKTDYVQPLELEKMLFMGYRRFYLNLNRVRSGMKKSHHRVKRKYVIRKTLRAIDYYLALRKLIKKQETLKVLGLHKQPQASNRDFPAI